MLRFLQFSCRLTASLIVKICPFRCLCGYYGDSLDVMFPNFLFPTDSYGVFACFVGCLYCFPSLFPAFPILDFAMKLVELRF